MVKPDTASFAVFTMEAKVSFPLSSPRKDLIRPERASFSPCRAARPSSDWTKSSMALMALERASATSLNVGARAARVSYFRVFSWVLTLSALLPNSVRALTFSLETEAVCFPSRARAWKPREPRSIRGMRFRQFPPKSLLAVSPYWASVPMARRASTTSQKRSRLFLRSPFWLRRPTWSLDMSSFSWRNWSPAWSELSLLPRASQPFLMSSTVVPITSAAYCQD